MIRALAICLTCLPQVAASLDLALPSTARLTAERTTSPDSYALPVAPFADQTLPVRMVSGQVTRKAWRLESPGLTTLQILQPLRDQLIDAGFEPILECETDRCGGFDFRFDTEVFLAPDMHVDLTDFRFLSAKLGQGDAAEHLSLLVSRSEVAGFVQMIRVSPANAAPLTVSKSGPSGQAVTVPFSDIGAALEQQGHVILQGLDFATGSSELGAGPFDVLKTLAAYLVANPGRRVALVGHTDSQGGLEGNIALSRRRAGSVRARLIQAHDVPAAQLDAEGMGYLAPVTSNLTPQGRETNRRVEAVLLNIK